VTPVAERLHAQRSPRTAVVWDTLQAAVDARVRATGTSILDILDSGGGTGTAAVPLAQAGHRITVVDASPNALATLSRRVVEAGVTGLVRPVQGDVGRLLDVVDPASVDAVLCHDVLEAVDDPSAALAGFAAALRPGGFLSVLCANRNAAVLARAVAGHVAEARRLLDDPDGRWGASDPMPRRYAIDRLITLLTDAGFAVRSVRGVRTFADLVPETVMDADLAAFESYCNNRALTAIDKADPQPLMDAG